ncbi:hypothetical protein A2313_00120 [Candidatus Roizmanbacteria bacterium RIFOXYB2_FULL_41_10]|uniref:AAA+ ATPase domain-containing protein n=1 Tax=Candidatus Roizmanbacteria bacterium RIFOXYA1_FULL_41_12 TaxID=1802082 RepID=A0A1F7KAP7_9BACT|nr:MAG: hypothetical protein A2209_04600 [Candidatus Roizmanbacteria bacterium RIFOXYA1_FULL_41_12]OGK66794.1 MAG: hypothetical protein A2377_02725 [Candidatus Roizmanbacteria bacterium RIFOXYB1_FULL_41_27]OGK70832.1 MAG: hypothetical protein A2403_01980 [Candidatus Roizmanbacteria bacterium RIFOXYC1_FULL_41_16]OGK71377.1 MAG: hypothetical protein A2313_00120 [Candidatus Roizmanbacteria bacterium RIFOXYB2_FULL_41_10]OGK75589.1 MAG: hypothetical protein A2575_02720 [Candidatus Roizmanbacteria ba
MAEISLWAIIQNKLQSLNNILVFLPFYFNVKVHFRHLFSPWKRLVGVRREKGFSGEDFFNELSMNLVSRSIGLMMRSLTLLIFLVSYILCWLILVPTWFILAVVTTPFSYLFSQIWPYKAQKSRAKLDFIKKHLLETNNTQAVADWFEQAWQAQERQKQILSLENLMQTPPLGRDWHYGFTPNLDDYCTDLTSPLTYRSILLDREKEIKSIEQALLKTENANVLLVGPEGVGKHTIIDGLAQRLNLGKVMPALQNQRLVELNMERVLSKKNSYEEKVALLEALLTEAMLAKNIIVVISDFHKYITGTLVGDYSSVWEKFAQRPLVRLLGITTPFYFEQLIFRNDKLHSLFYKIPVEEPDQKSALLILLEKALVFEKHYSVTITYEAIVRVIERCEYYVTHIPFPEKAISLLDEACLQGGPVITPERIDAVLRAKTHLPVGQLGSHLKHKLLNLEKLLSESIFGQDQAVSEIAKAVRRSYIEERRKKPLVSLLFLGPTGIGKTETAKALARIFFHSPDNLLRFDMSFYQNKENLNDLIGSYKQQNPGLLANAIREKPYSVFLIDEIEKANKDILNIFLTLLDEGYLIDGFGQRVDAKNLIFIATSNAASKEILNWVEQGKSQLLLENLVREYVIDQNIFTPEFLNRFDKTLVFAPLGLKAAYEIGYKIARQVMSEYLEQKKISLKVTAEELKTWIEGAYKLESGAREIDRVVRENLANKATNALLES